MNISNMSIARRSSTVSAASDLLPTTLVHTLRDYSESSKLSFLLRGKLKTFLLPLTANVTADCALAHGLAVGLANGQVVHYQPPCSQTLQVFDRKEVRAIVCLGEYLIVFSQGEYVEVELETMHVKGAMRLTAGEVTAAVKGLGETDLLVGFAGGQVEAYRDEEGELTKASTYQGGSDDVFQLNAIAGEFWFVATFQGSATLCCLWRYGKTAPLYSFSRSHDTILVPAIVVPEENNLIPMKEYQLIVEKHQIAFICPKEKHSFASSFLVNIGKGASLDIAEAPSKENYVYLRAKAEGKAAFLYEDFAMVFCPTVSIANDWLKTMLEKDGKMRENVFRAEIEFEYDYTVNSEDSQYIFLISPSDIQALFLCAVETTYTHADNHNYSQINDSQILHKRFSALYNSQGVLIKPLSPQRNYLFSPDLNYLYTFSQEKTDWQLIRIQDGQVLHQSQEAPMAVFSPLGDSVVLVYKSFATILSLLTYGSETVDCKLVESASEEGLQLFCRAEKWLFVFRSKIGAKAVKLEQLQWLIDLEVAKEFEKVNEVDANKRDFVLKFEGKICYYAWTGSNLRETASYSEEYLSIHCFGEGNYLVGANERHFHLFKLPNLQRIMTFGMDIRLNIDHRSATFSTYSIDPEQSAYLSLTYWDLSIGIPTHTLDLGLALVPGLSESVGFEDRVPQYMQCIGRLWRVPSWIQPDENKSPLCFYGAEYLPAYCFSLYRLGQLLSTAKPTITPQLARLVISPHNITLLHLLVHTKQPQLLSQALALGAQFLKGSIGANQSLTPINLILNSKERTSELDQCLDALLDGLTALSTTRPTAFLVAIHALEDDFCGLIRCKSAYLPSFLQTILVPLPAEFLQTQEMRMNAVLPHCDLWKDLYPHPPKWGLEKFLTCPRTLSPIFLICPIAFSMELKPGELLDVLKDIDAEKGILSKDVISYLAKAKWREVEIPMKLLSCLHWTLLILIACRIYDYGNEAGIQRGLLALNSALLLIETWQFVTGGYRNYFKEWWNYADLLRSGFTYAWIVTEKRLWLNFVVVALNSFIGLTAFEAFDKTRNLVRMILKVCRNTFYFVLIFIYSNLSFGVLCAVSDEDSELNFYESWTTAFEISMGGFDNTGLPTLRWFVFFAAAIVNMVWLLNLIVALLSTAYDNFVNVVAAEDVKAQFELTYKVESMVKCLVSVKGKKRFLHVYCEKQPSENPRDASVTIQSLREELEELKQDVKTLLARDTSANSPGK